MLKSVVSTCIYRDIDVWEVAHKNIVRYIDSENYYVIVPDVDYTKFKEITDSKYFIKKESEILAYSKSDIRQLLPKKHKGIAGWYYQQFLKLELTRSLNNGYVLIWDADTIPLKNLKFISEAQEPIYYFGNENHVPYYEFNNRLLNLEKKFLKSFIAQCLPVHTNDVIDLVQQIESTYQCDFVRSIINCIDPNGSLQQFSEYELVGNFVMSKKEGNINLQPGLWERNGKDLYRFKSNAINIKFNMRLSGRFDFVSVESGFYTSCIEYLFQKICNQIKKIRLSIR